MKYSQSRAMSFGEVCFSTTVGFGIALVTGLVVFPWFGFKATFHDNFYIAAIFTIVSIVRGYCIRRLFERFRL